jgi:glycosyltransferase 2 family protein
MARDHHQWHLTATGMSGLIGKRKGLVVRAAVSLCLLLTVVSQVDAVMVVELFARTDLVLFALTVLLLLSDRALMAFKWNLLTQVKGVGISLWQSLRIYLISNFVGIFLPTGVGGDIYRVYYTSSRQCRTHDVVASVVLERFVGIIASAAFALFGLSLMIALDVGPVLSLKLLVMTVGFLIVSLLAFWVSSREGTAALLQHVLSTGKTNWLLSKCLSCHEAYIEYKQYRKLLLVFFFLSLFEQGFFAIANYGGARAMGMDVEFIYFIGIIPVCQILMRIPISINAIGVQEGLYALFFAQLNVSVTEAFFLALLIRIGHWLVVLPGGVFYLTERIENRLTAAT